MPWLIDYSGSESTQPKTAIWLLNIPNVASQASFYFVVTMVKLLLQWTVASYAYATFIPCFTFVYIPGKPTKTADLVTVSRIFSARNSIHIVVVDLHPCGLLNAILC
jgi:hypothetical protein